MREGSRIAVHHPNQSAVIGNHEVRILIPGQKARKILQSLLHVAVNHHAALPGEVARENNIRLALGDRSGSLQKNRSDRKTACALVGRIFILVAGGIVEFLAGGVDEHRILRLFAVINFRPRELKAGRLDLRRSVFDQQDGKAIGRDLIDLRHDRAEAVRINKARIDPALAGFGGQLSDIDFARRQQHLLDAAVREVAIHVGGRESVIRAQRLDLGDRRVVRAKVPQANIVEQRGVLHGIDRCLPRWE